VVTRQLQVEHRTGKDQQSTAAPCNQLSLAVAVIIINKVICHKQNVQCSAAVTQIIITHSWANVTWDVFNKNSFWATCFLSANMENRFSTLTTAQKLYTLIRKDLQKEMPQIRMKFISKSADCWHVYDEYSAENTTIKVSRIILFLVMCFISPQLT